MDEHLEWDEYFMNIVYTVAMKSKDPNTKIGAVLVGPEKNIISTGYNNLPKGFDDSLSEYYEKPLKYKFFEHAERNALFNACLNGNLTKNSSIYVNLFPCCECMRALINSGIKNIIVHNHSMGDHWKEEYKHSMDMANIVGINVRFTNVKIRAPKMYFDGEQYDIT